MKVLLTKRRLFGFAKSPLIHEGGWFLALGSTLEYLTMIFSHKLYQKEKEKIPKFFRLNILIFFYIFIQSSLVSRRVIKSKNDHSRPALLLVDYA